MEDGIDPSRLIPADLWPRILVHVDQLTIEQWLAWRTISKQWNHSSYRLLGNLSVDYNYKDKKTRKLKLELLSGNLRSFSLKGPMVPLTTSPVEIVDFITNFSVTGLHTLHRLEKLELCNLGSLLDTSTLVSASSSWSLLRDLTLKGFDMLDTNTLEQILRQTPFIACLSLQGIYSPEELGIPSLNLFSNDVEPLILDSLDTVELDDCAYSLVLWLPLQHVRVLRFWHDRGTESAAFDFFRALPFLETLELRESNVVRFSSLAPQEPGQIISTPKIDLSSGFALFQNLRHLVLDDEVRREESPPLPIDLALVFQLPCLTSLSTWNCVMSVPKPPNLELGESPPAQCLKLKEWRLAPNRRSHWTWGVLQLVPNLTRLTVPGTSDHHYLANVRMLDPDATAAQIFNSLALPFLTELHWNLPGTESKVSLPGTHISECTPMLSRLKAVSIRSIISSHTLLILESLNPDTLESLSLELNNTSPSKLFDGISNMGSAIPRALPIAPVATSAPPDPLRSSPKKLVPNMILRSLDLSQCMTLGPLCLPTIVARLPNLTSLDVSLIPGVWATHLRFLQPLIHLRFIGHVVARRPAHSLPAFSILKGFWPLLNTIKLENNIDLKLISDTFGPLVKLLLVDPQLL